MGILIISEGKGLAQKLAHMHTHTQLVARVQIGAEAFPRLKPASVPPITAYKIGHSPGSRGAVTFYQESANRNKAPQKLGPHYFSLP